MRTRTVVASMIVAISATGTAVAQNCDAIITHGLRNIEITKSSSASLATKYYNNCGKDFATASDDVLANAEVEVFGYGKGTGGFSRQQREEHLRQWCTTNKQSAESNQSLYQESQNIYAGAVRAWDSCNRLKSSDVIVNTEITVDNRALSTTIRYQGPGTSGIRFAGIASKNFDCDLKAPFQDRILDADGIAAQPGGIPLRNEAISLVCQRAGSKPATVAGETVEKLESAFVIIRTASSQNILIDFPEQYDRPLPLIVAAKLQTDLKNMQSQVDVTNRSISDLRNNISSLERSLTSIVSRVDQSERVRSGCVDKPGHGHFEVKFSSPLPFKPIVTFSIQHDGPDPRPVGFLAGVSENGFVVRTDNAGEIGPHRICYLAMASK